MLFVSVERLGVVVGRVADDAAALDVVIGVEEELSNEEVAEVLKTGAATDGAADDEAIAVVVLESEDAAAAAPEVETDSDDTAAAVSEADIDPEDEISEAATDSEAKEVASLFALVAGMLKTVLVIVPQAVLSI